VHSNVYVVFFFYFFTAVLRVQFHNNNNNNNFDYVMFTSKQLRPKEAANNA